MGLSTYIKYTDDSGALQTIDYSTLSATPGRKFLDIGIGELEQNDKRFHVPGVDGNYIIRGGRSGGLIECDFMYIGDLVPASINNLMTMFDADITAYSNRPLQVDIYTNCNLLSFRKVDRIKPLGVTEIVSGYPLCFLMVKAVFQRD